MDEIAELAGYASFWTCEHVVNGVRKAPAGPFSARQMREYVDKNTRRIGEQVIISEWHAKRVRSWEQGL